MTKILIVDDEPMMLMVTKKILSERYEIITASSGKEAIELYEKEKADLILTDLFMPEMTGFEMHQTLQKQYGLNIPVIYMTADDTDEVEGKGFDLGAADFIRKPFRADVLLRRVGNILDSRAQIKDLKVAATTDKMTGLLNKGGATAAFTEAVSSSDGAFMMIDLDSFKLVNDLYGHDDGDDILKCFSDVLRQNLKPGDIIGRMGGDEFAAFMYHVAEEKTIEGFSRRINEDFMKGAKRILGEEMSIPLGASVGAVFVPKDGKDYEEVFKLADKVLYDVKQNGKHGFAVYKKVNELVEKEQVNPKEELSKLNQIMEERNITNSALWLGQEDFGSVFRFMYRFMNRYDVPTCEMIFIVEPVTDTMTMERLEEIVRVFGVTINKQLRKSDLMMQNKHNQFFLLLPELDEENANVVKDRMLEVFRQFDFSKEVRILCTIRKVEVE